MLGNREAVTREKGEEAAGLAGGGAGLAAGAAPDEAEGAVEAGDGSARDTGCAGREAARATAVRPEGVSVTRVGVGRGEGAGGMYSLATTEAIICSDMPVDAEPATLRTVRASLVGDVLCACAGRVSLGRGGGDVSASVGGAVTGDVDKRLEVPCASSFAPLVASFAFNGRKPFTPTDAPPGGLAGLSATPAGGAGASASLSARNRPGMKRFLGRGSAGAGTDALAAAGGARGEREPRATGALL